MKLEKCPQLFKFLNKPQLLQTCMDGYAVMFYPSQLVVELTCTKAHVQNRVK